MKMKKVLQIALIASPFSVLVIVSQICVSLEAHAAALDPQRDLSVSFSSKRGAPDPGYIIGRVKNKSGNTYPCVRLTFNLSTRYDMRRAGERGRHLGFLSTEVKNIQPGSTVGYEVELPYPAGFGLESVDVCQDVPAAQPEREIADAPQILSFRISPATIKAGEWVKFYWEVKDAERVKLLDNIGEVQSNIRLSSGEFGWPLSMSGEYSTSQNKTTTYELVAENQQGKTTKKTFTVQVAASGTTAGTCTIWGQLTGKWRQKIQERPGSPASTWVVDVDILTYDSRERVAGASVNNKGQYQSRKLPAERRFLVRPRWKSEPREDVVLCKRDKNHKAATFRITGRPLID